MSVGGGEKKEETSMRVVPLANSVSTYIGCF